MHVVKVYILEYHKYTLTYLNMLNIYSHKHFIMFQIDEPLSFLHHKFASNGLRMKMNTSKFVPNVAEEFVKIAVHRMETQRTIEIR